MRKVTSIFRASPLVSQATPTTRRTWMVGFGPAERRGPSRIAKTKAAAMLALRKLPKAAAALIVGAALLAPMAAFANGTWQRVELVKITERHFVQEKENSCVFASARNLIFARTGVDVPESQLESELAEVLGVEVSTFANGVKKPGYIVDVLAKHGVEADVRWDVSLNELVELASDGRPLLIGYDVPQKHLRGGGDRRGPREHLSSDHVG